MEDCLQGLAQEIMVFKQGVAGLAGWFSREQTCDSKTQALQQETSEF